MELLPLFFCFVAAWLVVCTIGTICTLIIGRAFATHARRLRENTKSHTGDLYSSPNGRI